DNIIYSKPSHKRDLTIAMMITRILHPSSKLENTRYILKTPAFKDILKYINYEKLEVDDLYETLDWLNKRQRKIEKGIYSKRHKGVRLFLYDITSVYCEGEKQELTEFGYERSKRCDKKQIVIGLVTDKDGYPLSVEVFKGNTSDQTTLIPKVKGLKERYGLKDAIIIGDRGMITESKMDKIEENGFLYITALTHKRIEKLIEEEKTPFQLGLFDERNIVEIEYKGDRYILCKSEKRAKEEKQTLDRLIEKTSKKLDEIKTSVMKGKLRKKEKIGMRVGRWINRWKVGKYFWVKIEEKEFEYGIEKEKLEQQKMLCGCYVIKTNIKKEEMESKDVVEHYKKLTLVERAFRIIKTTLLQIRPIYHFKERRIKAHAFICMLAYYLVCEIKKRLKKFFEKNGTGKDYKFTFNNVLDMLEDIQIGIAEIRGIKIKQLKPLNDMQNNILNCLNVKLKVNKEVEVIH
ncbi:MAG: IS1634 family transposase, partial [Candidatus Jordarchaeum sp.]|uniref:IS1634 family transposase n=1 Tax=Candidatus Jordarchaeum sp. TaxID=2823881 RepID=UPI0040492B78